ncbi:LytR/AlgR family response regulator transcription factor [Sphingobacterium kyonggiense]
MNKEIKIKAIALDDEPIALDIIKRFAAKVPFIQLEQAFHSAKTANKYLQENEVHLLFLDVRMPDISGIDFYKTMEVKPMVIFSTAYPDYALEGFELEALDYLLKPYSFDRFEKACQRAKEILELKGILDKDQTIYVKDGYKLIKVNLDEVGYIEAVGNYIRFHLPDQEVLARMTIKEFLQENAEHTFIQIHRSFIVNRNHIEKLDRQNLWVFQQELPIGASYAKSVKEVILP